MWTCAPCGTANEPHALFCSDCGVMRAKAPVREPSAPPEPLPEIGPPEFQWRAKDFLLWWTVATLGAMVAAWFLQTAGSTLFTYTVARTGGVGAARAILGLQSALIYGLLVGSLQAWVLSRSFGRPGWGRWTWATLGGTLTQVVCWLVLLGLLGDDLLARGNRFTTLIVHGLSSGVVAGGLMGVLQSRVLARNLGRGSWHSWILVVMGACTLGNLAGALVWQAASAVGTASTPLWFSALGLAHTLVDGFVTALLMGLPLVRSFRRRCAPLDIAPPPNPGAISR